MPCKPSSSCWYTGMVAMTRLKPVAGSCSAESDMDDNKNLPAFLERWNGQTAFDMVQLIKQSMPQEAPDSLGQPVYVDIVAFLLKTNGLPAGTAELPADDAALKQVQVTSRAPTP